jgi:hypothetical protein
MQHCLLLSLLLVAVAIVLNSTTAASVSYQNPLYPLDFADPFVLTVNGTG